MIVAACERGIADSLQIRDDARCNFIKSSLHRHCAVAALNHATGNR
jgi:hypothetical protein